MKMILFAFPWILMRTLGMRETILEKIKGFTNKITNVSPTLYSSVSNLVAI